MRKIAVSRLTRAFGHLALALVLGGGVLLAALPAKAEWHGGWHGGCCGWGWHPYVGFYGWPAYPYPYYPDYAPYYPPVAVAPTPTVAPAAPAAAPAAANTWYYCGDSKGYYPYVQTCASGWQQVPASPPK